MGLGSCKYSNTPESVTEKFLVSFNRMDYATAKSISTESTNDFLNIMERETTHITEDQKEAFAQKFKVTIEHVSYPYDSLAIVQFRTNPKQLPFNKLKLIKTINRNDKIRWKVDFSTLDLLQDDNPFGPLDPIQEEMNDSIQNLHNQLPSSDQRATDTTVN